MLLLLHYDLPRFCFIVLLILCFCTDGETKDLKKMLCHVTLCFLDYFNVWYYHISIIKFWIKIVSQHTLMSSSTQYRCLFQKEKEVYKNWPYLISIFNRGLLFLGPDLNIPFLILLSRFSQIEKKVEPSLHN